MLQVSSLDARTPLGTCLGFNTSVDSDMPLQNAWDRKQAREAQIRQQEDAIIIRVLETACCARQCGWRNCDAVLGSWELLRKVMLCVFMQEVCGKGGDNSYFSMWRRCIAKSSHQNMLRYVYGFKTLSFSDNYVQQVVIAAISVSLHCLPESHIFPWVITS